MKTVLIQQVYPNREFLPLIHEQFVRNTEYCEKFDIDYQFFLSEQKDAPLGQWDKLYHIQDALKYDLIIWLDADAILFDTETDLKSVPLPNDSIGAVKFKMPVQHFNVGVLYMKPGKRSIDFLNKWVTAFPGKGAWREQSVFNEMVNDCIVELPQTWNRNFDNNSFARPVVMGFHGYGEPEKRLELMRKVLHGT